MASSAVNILLGCLLFAFVCYGQAQNCSFDSIPVESNLNAAALQGKWYFVKMNQFIMNQPMASIPAMLRTKSIVGDITMNADGTIGSLLSAAKLFGQWCYQWPFSLQRATQPGRLILSAKGVEQTMLMLSFNETRYAVIYGCWKIDAVTNICPNPFLWVLTRAVDTVATDPSLIDEINSVATRACVKPVTLVDIDHTSHCQFASPPVQAKPQTVKPSKVIVAPPEQPSLPTLPPLPVS